MKDSASRCVYALLLGALVFASAAMMMSFPRSGALWVALIVSGTAWLSGRAAAKVGEVRWDAGDHVGLTLSQVAIPVPPRSVRP